MSIILSITTDRKPGGIATALHSYSQALSMRGHQHYVLLPSGSSAITSLLQLEGVTVVSMPAPLIRLHLLTRGLFSRKLRSAARAADMLLVHNARLTSPARSLGKPVALISHSGKMRHINAADHLVVLTSTAADRARADLAASGTPSATGPYIHVIPHGFATADAKSLTTQAKTDLRVMAAGRFVEKKGFEMLLAAAAQLEARRVPVQFDLFGDGPISPVLTHLARQHALSNVTFHGWQPNLIEMLDQFDLFCLPSNEEPFGLVIGETMRHGIPMVATQTDGPIDVLGHAGITKENTLAAGGLLVATGDAQAMADAIAFFAADRKALVAAGQAAHKRMASAFSMSALADRLDLLITTTSQLPAAGRS